MITEADARELEAALKTTDGREQIAQTMYEPFKKGRDYVAIFRQVFAVDHLPAGAPSWYDLDPQFTAAVVGAKGGVNFSEIEATRINVDPQILAVYPKVHALDVAVRRLAKKVKPTLNFTICGKPLRALDTDLSKNSKDATMDNPQATQETGESPETTREDPKIGYDIVQSIQKCICMYVNILDREQERAQYEMAKLEDDNGFTAIRNANLSGNDIVNANQVNAPVTSSSGLTLGSLADGFALVSQFDIPVANVVLHALQTRDIRVWTHRQFDPVTQRELLKTGYIGDIWGAQVRESRRQLPGTINVLGDPQYLGVLSVRIDQNRSHGKQRHENSTICGNILKRRVGTMCLKTPTMKQWTIRRKGLTRVKNPQRLYVEPKNFGMIKSDLIGNVQLTQMLSHMDAPDPANLFYG